MLYLFTLYQYITGKGTREIAMPEIILSRRYAQKVANTLNVGSGTDTINLTVLLVDLYTAGPTPTPNSVIGDFTIAAFPGYAQDDANVVATVNKPDGSVDMIYEPSPFQATGDPTATVTIVGALIRAGDDTFGQYLGGVQFTQGIPIIRRYDGFSLPITLNFGSSTPQNNADPIV